jgi:hypothetical protein
MMKRIEPVSQRRANVCYVALTMMAAGLLGFGEASAQQIQLLIQEQPFYVGEPVVMQIVAKFNDDKPAVCRLVGTPPQHVQVQGPEVSKAEGSYTQIINGRIRSERTITYRYSFVLNSSKTGAVSIGPFEVEHDGETSTLAGASLNFEQLDSDSDMRIDVSLGTRTMYVGQRVPVTIRWSFAPESSDALQYAFQNLQIRSPLFDRFEFEDAKRTSRIGLRIATAKGPVEVDAKESQEVIDGRTVVALEAQRTMIASSVGEFRDISVSCRTVRGSQWRRSFFGTEPGRTFPAIATGDPLSFSVRPLPVAGRPASFSGAVGSGFSIDVSANRSVVRVGDPISLNVTLRGEGLETMSLPDLSVDGGMSPDQFQLPNERPAGSHNGNTKQFKVSVRVKDEGVTQVPGLAFSWFDPHQEQYVTARSKPIALQVMPAQVVSASDVVSSAALTRSNDAEGPAGDITSNGTTPVKSLVPQGANLAIEQDISRLLSERRSLLGVPVTIGSYIVGIAMLVTAVFVRRRGEIDPAEVRRKQDFSKWRRQIVDAGQRSGKESAESIASALRQYLPSVRTPTDRARLNELIGECDNLVYAPTDTGESKADLVARALRIVDDIRQG